MKEYKFKINGNEYVVAVNGIEGGVADVTVNGVAKALNEVALHDGDAVVITATPNTNYEISEWTHSENVSANAPSALER